MLSLSNAGAEGGPPSAMRLRARTLGARRPVDDTRLDGGQWHGRAHDRHH